MVASMQFLAMSLLHYLNVQFLDFLTRTKQKLHTIAHRDLKAGRYSISETLLKQMAWTSMDYKRLLVHVDMTSLGYICFTQQRRQLCEANASGFSGFQEGLHPGPQLTIGPNTWRLSTSAESEMKAAFDNEINAVATTKNQVEISTCCIYGIKNGPNHQPV